MVKIAWDLLLALWICVAAVILERRTNIQSQRVTSLYSGKSKSTNTADKQKNVKLGEYGRLDSWILSQSIWQRIWKGGNWGSIRGVFFPPAALWGDISEQPYSTGTRCCISMEHSREVQPAAASNSSSQHRVYKPSTSSPFVPIFIPWHFQMVQKLSYTTSGVPLCWYSSFTLLEESSESNRPTHVSTKWIL